MYVLLHCFRLRVSSGLKRFPATVFGIASRAGREVRDKRYTSGRSLGVHPVPVEGRA
jgi:hypothetical protein